MSLAQLWVTQFLILSRLAGMILGCPVLAHPQIPRMWKAGLALALTALLGPLVQPASEVPVSVLGLLLAGVREAVLGFGIAWLSCLSLQVVGTVGALVDLQSGLSNAALLDPVRGESQSLFSVGFHALAALLFVQSDGPLILIHLLAASFAKIQPGQAWDGLIAGQMLGLGQWVMITVFQLSIPWMLAMLAVDAVSGIWGRLLPQLNLLSAGPPLKVLVCLWLTLTYFHHWLHQFSDLQFQLIRGWL